MTDTARTSSYLKEQQAFPFCKGCGHHHVVTELNEALVSLRIEPAKILLVSDIGCIGLVDSLFPDIHTMHTTHGRSTAFATGVEIADSVIVDSGLKTIVVIGDGGAMIGLLHLVNAALMNVDVTVILANNFLFGMTGGQNSNFSPLNFITPTSPNGTMIPPIDICTVLEGCGAGFLARMTATDKELPGVIAKAILHPGFALVEIVELCTEYAVKPNELNGKSIGQILERHGLSTGILRQSQARSEFGSAYTEKYQRQAESDGARDRIAVRWESTLKKQVGIVVAGTAGEHVQLAAHLLARSAVMSGLECTQKNDNPVTQSSGFSLSEVCISPTRIYYTGIDEPDCIIATSAEGVTELASNGTFMRATGRTLLIADSELALPETKAHIVRFPLRKSTAPARAAVGGIFMTLLLAEWIPVDAFVEAVREKSGAGFPAYEHDFETLRGEVASVRNLLPKS